MVPYGQQVELIPRQQHSSSGAALQADSSSALYYDCSSSSSAASGVSGGAVGINPAAAAAIVHGSPPPHALPGLASLPEEHIRPLLFYTAGVPWLHPPPPPEDQWQDIESQVEVSGAAGGGPSALLVSWYESTLDTLAECAHRSSSVPTLRIVYQSTRYLPRRVYANPALLDLFGITLDRLMTAMMTVTPTSTEAVDAGGAPAAAANARGRPAAGTPSAAAALSSSSSSYPAEEGAAATVTASASASPFMWKDAVLTRCLASIGGKNKRLRQYALRNLFVRWVVPGEPCALDAAVFGDLCVVELYGFWVVMGY